MGVEAIQKEGLRIINQAVRHIGVDDNEAYVALSALLVAYKKHHRNWRKPIESAFESHSNNIATGERSPSVYNHLDDLVNELFNHVKQAIIYFGYQYPNLKGHFINYLKIFARAYKSTLEDRIQFNQQHEFNMLTHPDKLQHFIYHQAVDNRQSLGFDHSMSMMNSLPPFEVSLDEARAESESNDSTTVEYDDFNGVSFPFSK